MPNALILGLIAGNLHVPIPFSIKGINLNNLFKPYMCSLMKQVVHPVVMHTCLCLLLLPQKQMSASCYG